MGTSSASVGKNRLRKFGRLVLGTLALLDGAFWVYASLASFLGLRRMTILEEANGHDGPAEHPRKLSVIVPARDEEDAVGESLDRMLAQDYPELEVIAVDDRSTDRTGGILQDAASRHSNLRILRVDELPPGWLGKTHALHLGATQASGEWLLFTDADVYFSPGCFRRAVGYAGAKRLDHMTLVPELVARGVWLGSFVAAFQIVFSISQRPWRAADPCSAAHVGVGAFNLVRRSAYEAAGSHEAIALRPDDDMKLAKLLKRNGFRTEVVFGRGLVSVEWQRSLRAAVRGLEKSAFPGLDYDLGAVLSGSLLLFLTNVVPFAGVLLTRGKTRAAFAACVLAVFGAYANHASYLGIPVRYAALHPFGALALVYATLRSTRKVLASGGLEWRGTRYPLDQLKRNIV